MVVRRMNPDFHGVALAGLDEETFSGQGISSSSCSQITRRPQHHIFHVKETGTFLEQFFRLRTSPSSLQEADITAVNNLQVPCPENRWSSVVWLEVDHPRRTRWKTNLIFFSFSSILRCCVDESISGWMNSCSIFLGVFRRKVSNFFFFF